MIYTTKLLASLLLCICLLTFTCSSDDSQGNTRSVKVSMSLASSYFESTINDEKFVMILVNEAEQILDQKELIQGQKVTVEATRLSEDENVSFYFITDGIQKQGVTKNLFVKKFTNIDGAIDIDAIDLLPTKSIYIELDNINKDDIERYTDNIDRIQDAGDDNKALLNVYVTEGSENIYCSIKKNDEAAARYIWLEDAPFGTNLEYDFEELPLVMQEQSIKFPAGSTNAPFVNLFAYNNQDYDHSHKIISSNSFQQSTLNDEAFKFHLEVDRFDEFFVDISYLDYPRQYQKSYLAGAIENTFVYPDIDFEIVEKSTTGLSYTSNSNCDFHRGWIANNFNAYLNLSFIVYGYAEQQGEINFPRAVIDEFTKDYPDFNFDTEMLKPEFQLSRSADGQDLNKAIARRLVKTESIPLEWFEAVLERD